MSYDLNIGSTLHFNRQTLFFSAVLITIISALGIWISVSSEQGLFVLLATIGITGIFFIIKYPKLWLYTIALSSFFFFRASSEGVSAADVAYGSFFIAGTFIWIIWKMLIQRERIVKNPADWSILFFYFFLLFNSLWSLSDEVRLLDWFREYALFSTVLLYFPIKYYIKEKRDISTLLILFAVSVVICSIDQLRTYKETALAEAVYAFQLGISVRINQTLFSASILYSIMLSLVNIKLWKRMSVGIFSLISISALLVSFSRSFWLFIIFGLILLFFYLDKKQKIALIISLFLVSSVGLLIFVNVFKEKTKIMTQVIEKRILSSTEGKKDISVQLRLIEYEQVLRGIKSSPFFGKGLGSLVEFYDPDMHFTYRRFNVHNSYLFIIYRVGIPLAFFFFFPIFYRTFYAERLARRVKDKFFKALLLGAGSTLLMMIVASFASAQFFNRDGTIVMAVSFALIDIIRDKFEKNIIT